jgi:hypothetical protein
MNRSADIAFKYINRQSPFRYHYDTLIQRKNGQRKKEAQSEEAHAIKTEANAKLNRIVSVSIYISTTH